MRELGRSGGQGGLFVGKVFLKFGGLGASSGGGRGGQGHVQEVFFRLSLSNLT